MPRQWRTLATFLVLLLVQVALGQDKGWSLSAFAGQSQLVMGSHDTRKVSGLGIAYNAGEYPRFRWGRRRGDLHGEIYYELSESNGVRKFPPDSTSTFGVLLYSRYRWSGRRAPGFFVDIGWGIQYSGQATHDLQSKLNSTPFFDVGVILGNNSSRTVIGARFMHVSNANTNGQNDGQNPAFVLIQIPF